MIISQMPQDYQPAFKELIYTIEQADPEAKIEVEIRDNSLQNCISIKRLWGEAEYHVNIAPYVQQQFGVEPIASKTCGFVSTTGRIVAAAISVDGATATPKRVFTAARWATPIHAKLSQSPKNRIIAINETDEIAIIATGATLSATALFTNQSGSKIKLTIGVIFATEGVWALVIAMGDLAEKLLLQGAKIEDQVQMEIVVSVDAIPKITQVYTIVPQDQAAVRIAWVNNCGAIDYYSCCYTAETKVENKGGNAKIVRKIVSQYENCETMLWIAQIATAAKVWEVVGGQFIPIEIECQEVIVQSEQLSRLEISAPSLSLRA